jgi:hypothetical protein
MTPRDQIQEYEYYDPSRLHTRSRWGLLRDALVLQGKLVIDGIRDAVLGPIGLVAAVLDILGVGQRAGRHFYDVVRFGRATEHWINLFGAADALPGGYPDSPQGLDAVVERLERVVIREYERGGMTSKTKEAVDRAIDRIQARE